MEEISQYRTNMEIHGFVIIAVIRFLIVLVVLALLVVVAVLYLTVILSLKQKLIMTMKPQEPPVLPDIMFQTLAAHVVVAAMTKVGRPVLPAEVVVINGVHIPVLPAPDRVAGIHIPPVQIVRDKAPKQETVPVAVVQLR